MITVKLSHPAPGATVYGFQVRDIHGEVIRGGSECYAIGFMDDYAPAGMTGLQHYTAHYDALAYEQISRDVLHSMLDAQMAEIERIRAAGISPFHLACHRSQFTALAALEKDIITYSASMRIK